MIGVLPKSLEVDGKEYEINSDFRTVLVIFQAYNAPELTDFEKMEVCLQCIYKERPKNVEAALEKAMWFLDGGDMPKSKQAPVKIMDWEYDQSMYFPAVNKAAGYETREAEYLHWWSFLGLFNEIPEGLYSQVMNIRSKIAKGKPLEKYEVEFYNDHKELINIKEKLTEQELAQEQADLEFVNSLI